jgi:hypothetical protein
MKAVSNLIQNTFLQNSSGGRTSMNMNTNNMDSPPNLRRLNRWIGRRRKNASKFMLLFASFLVILIFSIHVRYLGTLIASSDKAPVKKHSRKKNWTRKNNQQVDDEPKPQEFVIVSGASSSGYTELESNFANWTQEFKMYPWSWALPELSSAEYTKKENFRPFIESLVYTSATVPENEAFDRKKRILITFLLSKFQDGFVEQWVQNRNILMGSDELSVALDETNGDNFMRAITKHLPWNDKRYALLKGGKLSVIILHRSSHQNNLRRLYENVISNGKSKNGETVSSTLSSKKTFTSWLVNDFNFDTLDSYGLANKLLNNGISVSFVNVDDIEDGNGNVDLTHYVSCNVLNFSCKDGQIIGLAKSNDKNNSKRNNDNDNMSKKLALVDEAIKRHESRYKECLKKRPNIVFYPRKKNEAISNVLSHPPCPTSNQPIKDEIRQIIVS